MLHFEGCKAAPHRGTPARLILVGLHALLCVIPYYLSQQNFCASRVHGNNQESKDFHLTSKAMHKC